MAAVTLLHPSHDLHAMAATRRVPLADNPNAANSPFRQQSLNVKRQRPLGVDFHDDDAAAQPPQKKQAVGTLDAGSRRLVQQDDTAAATEFFNPGVKKDDKPIPDFQRRLVLAREASKSQNKQEKADKGSNDADNVRQWRRHYKKVFPNFVFYFESLPSDIASKSSRQIAALGAKEEKFFSKSVTHIVTSRPVPPDAASAQACSRTINPSLLDKAGEAHRARMVLDLASQRRSQMQAGTFDVLVKAREMKIKIWAIEKFERMMHTMFETDSSHDDDDAARAGKATKATNLAQLLKNERESRPSQAAPWQEIIPFKGYYIYIHDMDEKVKPVMVREYPKVSVREEGDWPMFRSVSSGRCPFVEEPMETREERAKRKMREAQKIEQEQRRKQQASIAARTRSATKSPQKVPLRPVTEEALNKAGQGTVPSLSKFEPPKLRNTISGDLDSMPPMLGSTRANFQGISRNPGGEPAASGVQRNITSAIRSQMISSTAAAPGGGRVGTSKEMHQLQRRVLEQRTGSNLSAQPSMGSSYLNDVRAAINNDSKPTTRRADNAALVRINEDDTISDADVRQPKAPVTRKRAAAKREPKPGYCENCRDKYDDFAEHIESRKHEKFALDNRNFQELDTLLAELTRR